MFGFLKKKSKYPYKPPSKSQVEECERLGLTIKPKMSSHDVWEMVNKAKTIPKYKKIDDEYRAKQNALAYKELREEYNYEYGEEYGEDFGDKLVDELERWEKFTLIHHNLIVYKKGKTITSDVVEFERVDINDDANKPYIQIDILRPKVYKPRDESHRVEWDKEVVLKSNQILHCRGLKTEVDMFDLDRFEKELNNAKELAAKYSSN